MVFQVPNAVGIVLGAAQLGIYMVYRKWSPAAAAMEMDEEGGVKRSDPVENDDDEAHGVNKLGASIRNPSLSRQHSLKEPWRATRSWMLKMGVVSKYEWAMNMIWLDEEEAEELEKQ